jgi:hypothetical protein
MRPDIGVAQRDVTQPGSCTFGVEMWLVAMEGKKRRGGSGNAGTSADRVRPPKFDGSTSWTAFHCQFEAVASHNKWTSCEKAMHLLAILQRQVANILHSLLG